MCVKKIKIKSDGVLKYDNCSRLNSHHNWGRAMWSLIEAHNLHFEYEYEIHMRFENCEQMARFISKERPAGERKKALKSHPP